MFRRKMPGRSKKIRRKGPHEHPAQPYPPLMTYDPYVIRLLRSLETPKEHPKPPERH